MSKVGNKVINYSVYVKPNGRSKKVGDTTSIQLPSIEMLTDSIKGAGIMGEVDLPSAYQPGSMTLGINMRVTNEEMGDLLSTDSIEVRWVTDSFDTSNVKSTINAHKAFIKCVNKKFDEGKIEPGSAQDASFEYEVLAYKRVVNGKEVLNIDKLNGIFAINGTDYTKDIQAAL